MKKELKLAFSQLAEEMQVLTKKQSKELKGGVVTDSDCAIWAISFALNMDYNTVLNAYGDFMDGVDDEDAESWIADATTNGIDEDIVRDFANHMGLTVDGDVPQGDNGYTISGDQSIGFFSTGPTTGHVIVITGNASETEYYYYDPQNNVTGTIEKSAIEFSVGL